jgi:hypothetical protein
MRIATYQVMEVEAIALRRWDRIVWELREVKVVMESKFWSGEF